MKKLLMCAAALSLALGLTAAQADPNDHHDNKTSESRDRKNDDARHGQQNNNTMMQQGGHEDHMRGGQMMGPNNNRMSEPHGGTTAGSQGGQMMGPNNNRMSGSHGGTMMGPQGGQMMDHRGHVDWDRFRGVIHAKRHFHVGIWHAPREYRYRRWNFGERLPALYFVREYWLNDWAYYDLMPPPYGCAWVRYGPDALLVDLDTGEIIRVVYDVFD